MAGLEPDVSAPRTPQTAAEAEVVREQLGRILSSALFRNSKRFPVFLRYTVEHALNSAEPLKERTIGHEAFARDPAYDTAQDPVVRMTAAEVRKRLVQYYQRPEHSREIVIAYQSGSYVPEFSQPATPADTGSPPSPAAKSPRLLPSSRGEHGLLRPPLVSSHQQCLAHGSSSTANRPGRERMCSPASGHPFSNRRRRCCSASATRVYS